MKDCKILIINVLSDPSFKPPECLLDLNLKGNFKELLESCPKEVQIEFAINEAELVLPIWESKNPDDDRLRKILKAATSGIRNQNWIGWRCFGGKGSAKGNTPSDSASYAIICAAHAIKQDNWKYEVSFYVYHAIDYVKRADPSITLEDQIRRLLTLIRERVK